MREEVMAEMRHEMKKKAEDKDLREVKKDIQPSGADEDQEGRAAKVGHRPFLPPAPDPTSEEDEDQPRAAQQLGQVPRVSSSSDPASAEGEDHVTGIHSDQPIAIPPSVDPPQATNLAQRRAALRLARLETEYEFTNWQGNGKSVRIEDVTWHALEKFVRAPRTVHRVMDYLVALNVHKRAPQVSNGFIKMGECMKPWQISESVVAAKIQFEGVQKCPANP